jgi:hypothetical protein
VATACGGSDRPAPPLAPSPAPPPPPLDLNGAYVGSGDDFLGIGRMRWVLSHTGTAVEGTVTATDTQGGISARGTLAGRLDGSTLFFTIAMPRGGLTAVPSCSATIEGIGDVTVSTISGLFSGTATCSASFFGQFVLTKE